MFRWHIMFLKYKPASKKWEIARENGSGNSGPFLLMAVTGGAEGQPIPSAPGAHTVMLPDTPHPRCLSLPRTSLFHFSPCLWGHLSLWLLMKATLTCSTNGKYEAQGRAGQSYACDRTTSQSRAAQEPRLLPTQRSMSAPPFILQNLE